MKTYTNQILEALHVAAVTIIVVAGFLIFVVVPALTIFRVMVQS